MSAERLLAGPPPQRHAMPAVTLRRAEGRDRVVARQRRRAAVVC